MSIRFVLLPLFVEVLLTFIVMFGMMYFRTSTLRSGETRFEEIALREPRWPVRATQFVYSFSNQFELPVLFYVLTILSILHSSEYGCGAKSDLCKTVLSIMTHHADLLYVLLAWVFVVLRIFQAGVHVTNNNVRVRGAFFGAGAIILVIMWLVFIVRVVLALP